MQYLLFLIVYAIFCYPLMLIAQKTGQENPWFAFVPILNLVLMVQIAGKPIWWVVLFFVPLANLVVLILVWMAIAEARRKPAWMGILIVVPVANLVMPFLIAAGD